MHTITYIGSSFYRSYEEVIMEQLNLFSRITSGLALMREELRLQYEIAQYRRELRALSDIDDPDYVKPQTDRLIFLIERSVHLLALTREQRNLL